MSFFLLFLLVHLILFPLRSVFTGNPGLSTVTTVSSSTNVTVIKSFNLTPPSLTGNRQRRQHFGLDYPKKLTVNLMTNKTMADNINNSIPTNNNKALSINLVVVVAIRINLNLVLWRFRPMRTVDRQSTELHLFFFSWSSHSPFKTPLDPLWRLKGYQEQQGQNHEGKEGGDWEDEKKKHRMEIGGGILGALGQDSCSCLIMRHLCSDGSESVKMLTCVTCGCRFFFS